MEGGLVVDYTALRGNGKELIIKELAIAGKGIIQTFHFASPYPWNSKLDALNKENKSGINFNDGYIPYSKLKTILEEAIAGHISLFAYDEDKCEVLSALCNRAFINLQKEFDCPKPENLYHHLHCGFPCHKFSNTHCACKHAHAMFNWLKYHKLKKLNTRCPSDSSNRHDASFVSAV